MRAYTLPTVTSDHDSVLTANTSPSGDDAIERARLYSQHWHYAFTARVPVLAHARHWTMGDYYACFVYLDGQRINAYREPIPNPSPVADDPEQLGLFAGL